MSASLFAIGGYLACDDRRAVPPVWGDGIKRQWVYCQLAGLDYQGEGA
jgi:hypothetical protein